MTLPRLDELLAQHGLAGVPEQPFEHTGFSGATLTRLVRNDGKAFVLKRLSIDRDWIMRATDDDACREAVFGASGIDLGPNFRPPAVGAARDGESCALLMHDITSHLLPQGPITEPQLDTIVERMAELHRTPAPTGVPWCDLRRRLTLLTPQTARIADSYGAPVARDITEGWLLFELHATARATRIIHGLFADPVALLGALGELPTAFLHGDLKLDNIGLDPNGSMWLIDWAMTLVAPPAIELGWFLAINSRRLPVSLDEVMRRYAEAAAIPVAHRAHHNALTVMCGLLLRGWRKALDAEAGEPEELRWWCDRAEEAQQYIKT